MDRAGRVARFAVLAFTSLAVACGGSSDTSPPPGCATGSACTPASPSACTTYAKTCASAGGFTCDPAGAVADGTGCGVGEVCAAGSCVAACVTAEGCTPSGTPDACKTYGKTCNATLTGFTCDPVGDAADGTSCGSGEVCSTGRCVAACVAAETCTPSGTPDPCKTYGKSCNLTLTGFTCDPVADVADGTGCGGGNVCSAGSCVAACVAGSSCTPSGTPDACKTYGKTCNATLTGFTCDVSGNAADGNTCGSGQVCSTGSCVAACVGGGACTPSGTPDACKTYSTVCNATLTGSSCDATGNVAAGTTCGSGQVCDGSGSCVAACVNGSSCTPSGTPDACKIYGKTCNGTLTGFTCDVSGNAGDGTTCGSWSVCSSGSCVVDCTGAPDGTACGNGNSCAAGVCQAPCAHATVKIPGSGSPLWSPEFAGWLGANGYDYLAANQGWGGGTGCGGGASAHDPVILLHGNTNMSDPSTALNGVKAKLLAGGYTACDLYAITWIEQNSDTTVNHHKASYLKLVRDFMEAVKGYTGKSHVDVVGHSMGVTMARKAIQGGIAYEDAGRTLGCDLGPSARSGVGTLVGVAGVNRGLTMCAGSITNSCSDNGFKIDGAFLQDINGGTAGSYAPATVADRVYSIYLPADGYICGENPRGRGPWACDVFGTHTSIIPGGDFARSYDLFNEDYGNTYGLYFNCTPDAFGRVSNCDHILSVNDAFSVDAIVRMVRDHETATLPPPPFSQADLAGDWEEVAIGSNDAAGWQVASASIDGSGTATFTNVLNSDGTTADWATSLDVDDNGIVTTLDPLTLTSFHGKLSPDKNLLVGTFGSQAAGHGSSFVVLSRRVPGVTWSPADAENLAFRMLVLQTGGGTIWEYGTGTTDGTGAITISSLIAPGTPALPSFALHVAADGRVDDGTFHGVMTPDKTAIFGVHTLAGATPTYVFSMFLATGPTFAQADLSGTWEGHTLSSSGSAAASSWGFGRFAISSGGGVTFHYWASEAGASLPTLGNLTVATDGSVTNATNAAYQGQIFFNKDYYARVQNGGGLNSIGIFMK